MAKPLTPPKKKRKKRSFPEYQVQAATVALVRTHYPAWLMYHAMNGGRCAPQEATRRKNMGVLAGVHDLFLAEPNLVYNGMYLELKATKSGKLSKDQLTFKANAEDRNFYCSNAYLPLEALFQLECYMGIPANLRIGRPIDP